MRLLRKYLILLVIPVLIFIIVASNRVLLDKANQKSSFQRYFVVDSDQKDNWRPSVPSGFCSVKSDPYWQDGFIDDDANITRMAWPWNLTATWKCPDYYYNQYSLYRRKSTLECSFGSPRLVTTMTSSPRDIQVLEPGDACLQAYIRTCCLEKGFRVPNVMHYVWMADVEVGFYTMVSFVSVVRFMRPCLILFHGPYVPRGKFWNFFISIYPHVILVNETLITHIYGHELKFKEHGSDVMRINALKEYGGLYLDWDELLVRPVDPLRNFSFTMSLETPNHLGNQFILAEKNATFLHHWLLGYKNYKTAWAHNSIVYPRILSRKFPELIHVEPYTGLKGRHKDGGHLWHDNTDWSQNYAMHLYLRGFRQKGKLNMETIRYENTTIGALCRRILFGRKELCIKS